MQLTYRGHQYSVAPTQIATVVSESTATYRGATYSILKSNAVATVLTKNLKYRGISYSVSTEAPATIYYPALRSAMA